jgi:hypothetical protein
LRAIHSFLLYEKGADDYSPTPNIVDPLNYILIIESALMERVLIESVLIESVLIESVLIETAFKMSF